MENRQPLSSQGIPRIPWVQGRLDHCPSLSGPKGKDEGEQRGARKVDDQIGEGGAALLPPPKASGLMAASWERPRHD